MYRLGPAGKEDVEGDREGAWLEAAAYPSVRIEVFDDKRATEAVLGFLRDTWEGCMVSWSPRRRRRGRGRGKM